VEELLAGHGWDATGDAHGVHASGE
jgi:hypothetical protein